MSRERWGVCGCVVETHLCDVYTICGPLFLLSYDGNYGKAKCCATVPEEGHSLD